MKRKNQVFKMKMPYGTSQNGNNKFISANLTIIIVRKVFLCHLREIEDRKHSKWWKRKETKCFICTNSHK